MTVTGSINTSGLLISGQWVVYVATADRKSVPAGRTSYGLHVTNLNTGDDLTLGYIALGLYETHPEKYYAIDAPWVIWGSQQPLQNPRLNFYNLESRQTKSTLLPSLCPMNVLPGVPQNLVASDGLVLFRSCDPAGYDLHSGQFFAVPINLHDPLPAGVGGWAFVKGKLVWYDSFSGRTELYTASVAVSP